MIDSSESPKPSSFTVKGGGPNVRYVLMSDEAIAVDEDSCGGGDGSGSCADVICHPRWREIRCVFILL